MKSTLRRVNMDFFSIYTQHTYGERERNILSGRQLSNVDSYRPSNKIISAFLKVSKFKYRSLAKVSKFKSTIRHVRKVFNLKYSQRPNQVKNKKKLSREINLLQEAEDNSQYYQSLAVFNLVFNKIREDSNYIKQKNALGRDQPENKFPK